MNTKQALRLWTVPKVEWKRVGNLRWQLGKEDCRALVAIGDGYFYWEIRVGCDITDCGSHSIEERAKAAAEAAYVAYITRGMVEVQRED